MRDAMKRRAARAAADRVQDGQVVGLGSGSTAAHAIRALGERVEAGEDLVGVPTSHQSADLAREVGVPVRSPADVERIDVAIDGADQVAGDALIKGGGGAHAREKVIDAAAETFLVVVDERKTSNRLDLPVPLEVLPDARSPVAARIAELGGTPAVRRRDEGPFVTDNGNHVIDADLGVIDDPGEWANRLAAIPGVLEHGLFVGMANAIFVGQDEDVSVRSV